MSVQSIARMALLCATAAALSACVDEGPYGYDHDGYNHHRDYRGAYYDRDPCDYDDAYCSYPVYDGAIQYSGEWYGGRHRYRDHDGRREYWVHDGWHHAETEGGRRHDRHDDD